MQFLSPFPLLTVLSAKDNKKVMSQTRVDGRSDFMLFAYLQPAKGFLDIYTQVKTSEVVSQ